MSRDPFGLLGVVVGGKYRVEGVLGEGGNGVVYAATHLALGQPVAVKCLKLAPDGASEADVARFTREARVLFQLSHPGIVRMYDVGEVSTPLGPAPYVVLERVDGRGLDEAIRERAERRAAPFTTAEILAVFEPLLDALAFAHGRGVVHRDMKPSNVMVVSGPAGPSTKILDFGTARAGSTGLATTGAGGLTPRYAAPEQWNANYGSVGPTTDLFAVGLMLDEACTLDFALAGTTLSEIVAAATNPSRTTRVATVRPDLAALAAVVSRATAISPAARFASAAAMRDALREALTRPPSAAPAWPAGPPGPPLDRPSSLSPPGAAVSAPPAGPRSPSPAAHALRQPAPPSRAGWVVAAIAAPAILLVLGGAGGAAWYVHNTRTGPAVGPVVLPAPTASASAPTAPSAAASAPSAATVASNATSPTSPPAPSLARSAPAASATASAPRVAPSAPPTATPGRRLAYTSSSPTYGNLYPAQADFIRVVDTHAPGLQRCFQDERVADSWTITFTVKFAHGRSLSAMVVHEGAVVGTGDPTAERLRNCTYNAVAMWPWPAAPQQAPDAGAPYVRFFVGMVWQGSHG